MTLGTKPLSSLLRGVEKHIEGVFLSESGERVSYIYQPRQLHLLVVAVQIENQTQVPFALIIVGDFVVLSEDCH